MKHKEIIELDTTYLSNWESLNVSGNPIKHGVIQEWKELLDGNFKEQVYHKFLADNAGFFFHEGYPDIIVISKMKFGADFVSDFVVCYDKGSEGFQYELIELEKPTSKIFTKYDRIGSGLNSAIQQILSWQGWLLKHVGSIKNYFPASRYDIDGFINLRYTIIIGKGDEMEEYRNQQRNHLAHKLGISIRSYDYLTKLLKKSIFFNSIEFVNDDEKRAGLFASEFANPFYKAYTDKDWRTMIRKNGFSNYNMIANNINQLMEYRTYNKERLKLFYEFQNKQLK